MSISFVASTAGRPPRVTPSRCSITNTISISRIQTVVSTRKEYCVYIEHTQYSRTDRMDQSVVSDLVICTVRIVSTNILSNTVANTPLRSLTPASELAFASVARSMERSRMGTISYTAAMFRLNAPVECFHHVHVHQCIRYRVERSLSFTMGDTRTQLAIPRPPLCNHSSRSLTNGS